MSCILSANIHIFWINNVKIHNTYFVSIFHTPQPTDTHAHTHTNPFLFTNKWIKYIWISLYIHKIEATMLLFQLANKNLCSGIWLCKTLTHVQYSTIMYKTFCAGNNVFQRTIKPTRLAFQQVKSTVLCMWIHSKLLCKRNGPQVRDEKTVKFVVYLTQRIVIMLNRIYHQVAHSLSFCWAKLI